jgi:hypothetical protein
VAKGKRTGSIEPDVGQMYEVGQDVHDVTPLPADHDGSGPAGRRPGVPDRAEGFAERRKGGRRAEDRASEEQQARDEQRELYSTLDLALRVGEVLLSSGAGTAARPRRFSA